DGFRAPRRTGAVAGVVGQKRAHTTVDGGVDVARGSGAGTVRRVDGGIRLDLGMRGAGRVDGSGRLLRLCVAGHLGADFLARRLQFRDFTLLRCGHCAGRFDDDDTGDGDERDSKTPGDGRHRPPPMLAVSRVSAMSPTAGPSLLSSRKCARSWISRAPGFGITGRTRMRSIDAILTAVAREAA